MDEIMLNELQSILLKQLEHEELNETLTDYKLDFIRDCMNELFAYMRRLIAERQEMEMVANAAAKEVHRLRHELREIRDLHELQSLQETTSMDDSAGDERAPAPSPKPPGATPAVHRAPALPAQSVVPPPPHSMELQEITKRLVSTQNRYDDAQKEIARLKFQLNTYTECVFEQSECIASLKREAGKRTQDKLGGRRDQRKKSGGMRRSAKEIAASVVQASHGDKNVYLSMIDNKVVQYRLQGKNLLPVQRFEDSVHNGEVTRERKKTRKHEKVVHWQDENLRESRRGHDLDDGRRVCDEVLRMRDEVLQARDEVLQARDAMLRVHEKQRGHNNKPQPDRESRREHEKVHHTDEARRVRNVLSHVHDEKRHRHNNKPQPNRESRREHEKVHHRDEARRVRDILSHEVDEKRHGHNSTSHTVSELRKKVYHYVDTRLAYLLDALLEKDKARRGHVTSHH